jgi:ParB family chromosome partitioning protein
MFSESSTPEMGKYDNGVTFVGPAEAETGIHMVRIPEIDVGWLGRRRIDRTKLELLKDDIRLNGLLHPITLIKIKSSPKLVLSAGGHRLVAVTELGCVFVPAKVIAVNDLEEARDLQDSENAVRKDLTAAEQCFTHARRKRRYQEKHPEARRGGDRRSSQRGNSGLIRSYAVVAAKGDTLKDRTINEYARVGAILEPYSGKILGSAIEDSMTDLIQLAALDPSDIAAVLALLATTSVKTVAEAMRRIPSGVRPQQVHEQQHIGPITQVVKPPVEKFPNDFESFGKDMDAALNTLGQLHRMLVVEYCAHGASEKIELATSVYLRGFRARVEEQFEQKVNRIDMSGLFLLLLEARSLLLGKAVQCPVSCPSCTSIELMELNSDKASELKSDKLSRKCTSCRQIVKARVKDVLDGISNYISSMGGPSDALRRLLPEIPLGEKS